MIRASTGASQNRQRQSHRPRVEADIHPCGADRRARQQRREHHQYERRGGLHPDEGRAQPARASRSGARAVALQADQRDRDRARVPAEDAQAATQVLHRVADEPAAGEVEGPEAEGVVIVAARRAARAFRGDLSIMKGDRLGEFEEFTLLAVRP